MQREEGDRQFPHTSLHHHKQLGKKAVNFHFKLQDIALKHKARKGGEEEEGTHSCSNNNYGREGCPKVPNMEYCMLLPV